MSKFFATSKLWFFCFCADTDAAKAIITAIDNSNLLITLIFRITGAKLLLLGDKTHDFP